MFATSSHEGVRRWLLGGGLIVLALVLLGPSPVRAQFSVTGTSPSPNTATADTGATVVVTFNQDVLQASVTPEKIRVVGSQTGPKAEQDNLVSVSTNQITYDPKSSFAFGEQVTVSVDSSLMNFAQDTNLDTTETVQFRVQAGVGPSDFPVDSTITSSLSAPFDLAPADVNGDGRTDVMAAAWTGGVVWFANGGAGQSWTRNDIAAPFGNTDQIVAADIDTSGRVDAVVGIDTSIVWYENQIGTQEEDGDGFSNATVITGQVDDVRGLDVADVDGDGDLDVVSASNNADMIAWHENTAGDGTSWTTNTVTTGLSGAVSVEAVDLDGDNDPDLLASSLFDADQAVWYENDGKGTFGPRQGVAAPGDQAGDAHAADLDQDGDLDVLLMLAGSAKWYENTDGQGSFALSETLTFSVTGGDDIHSADLDGDGDLDVLTEAGSDSTIAWYENTDGQGTFGTQRVIAKKDQPRSVHAADIDGDDDVDVLSASRYDNTLAWYPNTEIAPQVATRPAGGTAGDGFTAVADVNPGGDTTSVIFEYGEDLTFGTDSTVTATTTLVGDDTTSVSATVSGLSPSTTYNYRVVASNALGSTTGTVETVATEAQGVFYVDASATGAATGASWVDAFTSLQDGLSAVGSGDTLWVAAGTYYPDVGTGVSDGRQDTSFVLPDGVALYGGFAGGESSLSERDVRANRTILSGDIDQDDTDPNADGLIRAADISGTNSHHVVRGPRIDGRIDGFFITAGDASGGTAPANWGGGIFLPNQSGTGPALTVNRTRLVGNRADQSGGGLYVDNANILLSNTWFLGNETASGDGGGLYVYGNDYGDIWTNNVVFSGNSAGVNGGAIANDGGVSLQNVTMTGNEALNGSGGGVYAFSSAVYTQVVNTTIWSNTAASDGAQIYNGSSVGMSFVLLEGDTTAIGGSGSLGSANGIVDGDPLFLDPAGSDGTVGTADDDLRLNWASPTIDFGPPNPFVPRDSADVDNDKNRMEPVPIDIAGDARLQGTNVDLGAYEGGAAPTGTKVVYADVASGADADSSGGSWADPYRTIHAAIAAARNARAARSTVPFTEVWVAEGTYYPDDGPAIQSGDRSVAIPLADSIAVYGGFQNGDAFSDRDSDPATNGTVLSGDIGTQADTSDNSNNVVVAGLRVAGGRIVGPERLGPTTRLDGFTIRGGNTDPGQIEGGGGIAVIGGAAQEVSPTFQNLHIRGNYAEQGGGIAIGADSGSVASPTLRHIRLENNEASLGGGLAIVGDSAATAAPRISESNILNNVATGADGIGGGAVIIGLNGTASPHLVNTRFFANQSALASALGISAEQGGQATPVIANTLINGNVATADSGAVTMQIQTASTLEPTFVNTTWAGNTLSSDSLSALINIGGPGTTADVRVANSILWGNAAQSLVGGQPSAVTIDSSIVQTTWTGSGSGTLVDDPLYVDADGADNTAGTADDSLQVEAASPALQHGGNSLLPPDKTDLDGDGNVTERLPLDLGRSPRVQQTDVDAGAYELDASGLTAAISVTPSSFSERLAFGNTTTKSLQIENTASGSDAAPLQYEAYVATGGATTSKRARAAQRPRSAHATWPPSAPSTGGAPDGKTRAASNALANLPPVVVDDPVASDTATVNLDRLHAGVSNGQLSIVLQHEETVDTTNYAFFLALDVDQDTSTGRVNASLNPGQTIGAEYEVNGFNLGSGSVTVYDTEGDGSTSVPVGVDSTAVHFSIPLTAISGTAPMDVVGITGTQQFPSDWFPNTGNGTIAGINWVALSGTSGTIDPGGSRSVSVTLSGEGTPPGEKTGTIHILSNDPNQDTTSIATTLTVDPPPVSISEPSTPPSPGSETPLDVGIPSTFTPSSGTLFFRTAGSRTVRDTALDVSGIDAGASGTVSATIPGDVVTKAGVAYYVQLTGPFPDGSGTFQLNVPSTAPTKTAFLPTTFSAIDAQGDFKGKQYRMVSIPVDLGDRSAFDILKAQYGTYHPSRWRLAQWNPRDSAYAEGEAVDSLRPGQAAWLITAKGQPLSVSDGQSADASGPKRIPLRPGWNQIGNPFPFPVAWADVQTPAAARTPFAFDGSSYQSDVQTLRPWQGLFLYNQADSTVYLTVPPVRAPSGTQAAQSKTGDPLAAAASVADGYRLHATANAYRNGTLLQDQALWLGFSDDARGGLGPMDLLKPPGIGPRVRLDAMSTDGPALARNIKPPSSEGAAWDLRVGLHVDEPLSSTQEVTIQIAEQGTRPDGFQRYIIDMNEGRRLPVVNGTVTLHLSKNQPSRRLRVIVGTESFARSKSEGATLTIDKTKLRTNAPNPFTETTTIAYQLAEKEHVTISIYDVLGRRVRTLVDGRQDAGVHEIRWRPAGSGSGLASGVYFCRMEAGSYTSTRKLVLVR